MSARSCRERDRQRRRRRLGRLRRAAADTLGAAWWMRFAAEYLAKPYDLRFGSPTESPGTASAGSIRAEASGPPVVVYVEEV